MVNSSSSHKSHWWIPVVVTPIATLFSLIILFVFIGLYFKFWHVSCTNWFNSIFGPFNANIIEEISEISFTQFLKSANTTIFSIIYYLLANAVSVIIGIKRKSKSIDAEIIEYKEALKNKSGAIGAEYKKIIEKKKRLKALQELLELNTEEAVQIMYLRKTTKIAKLENIYIVKNDFHAFQCCMENIYESTKDSKSNYLFINSIAQYEFIGRHRKYFNEEDGTIDKDALNKSVFLRLLKEKRSLDIRVLLLNPNIPESDILIKNRIKEIGKRIKVAKYKEDINKTIEFLEFLKNNLSSYDSFRRKKISIDYRLFNDNSVFRYYINNKKVFLSQYVKQRHGHQSMTFEIGQSSRSLHYSILKLFNKRWEEFKPK